MAWSFILTDANYVPLGEILNAQDRQVALPLNKLDTMSFKVRLDNPLASYLATTAGYVKAYRNGVLRFFGPLISAEEVGDAQGATVAVNAVGAGWILTKRLAGKSATGTIFNSATDRALIIQSLINATNSENESGITTGSMSSASVTTYTAGPYRPISEIITELSASFDGFDWRILPSENFANNAVTGPKIGAMLAVPSMGIDQPNAVFEWGTNGRNNIASYTSAVTRDTQANKVYHFTSNGPDAVGFPTVSAIDTSSISNWRLLEDLAQADLIDGGLRQRLVDEHVKVRALPRRVISATPHIDPTEGGRLPQYGVDYDVGDRVRMRAQYNNYISFDAMMRVWGVAFALDAQGVETASLTLAQE